MNRRQFLATTITASTIGTAGCGSDSNSDGDGGGGETTNLVTTESDAPAQGTTLTDSPTPEATETPEPAEFEVVEFRVPDSVRVGEEHNIALTIQNTGEQPGTFETVLEASTSRTSQWESMDVTIGPIEPGETVTREGDPATTSEEVTIQYRITEYGIEKSYEVTLPQPDISIGETAFVEADLGYSTERMAEVEVTNNGDGPTSSFAITVDWYDDDAYLASTEVNIESLGSGETWLARASPSYNVEDPSAITDFEVNVGDATGTAELNPPDVSISGDELLASEQQVLVRGDIENNRDTSVSYLEVIVKVMNDNGDIIGTGWTNYSDIAADGTVSFELEPDTDGRNGDVASHEALLTT